MKTLLNEMSWKEVKEMAKGEAIVVLPTGSIEQHGPHLPIDVDSRLVYEVAKRAAEAIAGRLKVVVTPLFCFGCSSHHMDFPGTLSLSIQTYINAIMELCQGLIRHGFQRILLLNGHGGNEDPLKIVARNIRDQARVIVAVASYWNIASRELSKMRESEPGGMGHGCELETSCLLELRPDLVDTNEIVKRVPTWRTEYIVMDLIERGRVSLGWQMKDFSESGVLGDPTLASQEKGERFLNAIVKAVADFLIDFSRWELDTLCY